MSTPLLPKRIPKSTRRDFPRYAHWLRLKNRFDYHEKISQEQWRKVFPARGRKVLKTPPFLIGSLNIERALLLVERAENEARQFPSGRFLPQKKESSPKSGETC
jgi:hypothetical protein